MNREHTGPVVLLSVISLAAFLVIVDGTVVALVLPSIGLEFGSGIANLAWVPNAYVLTYTVLLATAGILGDRLGRRPVFLVGVALFGIGSILCATAGSFPLLILGRTVQGAGAAAMLTLALAQISVAFPDRREWAMGILVTVGSLGGLLGPLLGGALAHIGGWRLVFWVLAAVAGISLALAWSTVAPSRGDPRPLDAFALLLIGAAVLGLNLALLNGTGWGWLSPQTIGAGGIGIIAAGALVVWEKRSPYPMLDLRALARPAFLGYTVASAAGWFAVFAVDIYTSVYLQQALGLGPVAAGLALAVSGLTGGVAGLTVGWASARLGPERLLVGSMMAMSALLLPWAMISGRWPIWVIILLLAAMGVPFTYTLALSAAGALGDLPSETAGLGAATFNTARQFGSSLGIAIPAAIIAWSSGAGGGSSAVLQRAFASAFLARAGVFAAASLAVALVLFWDRPRPATASPLVGPGEGR